MAAMTVYILKGLEWVLIGYSFTIGAMLAVTLLWVSSRWVQMRRR